MQESRCRGGNSRYLIPPPQLAVILVTGGAVSRSHPSQGDDRQTLWTRITARSLSLSHTQYCRVR
ncbi:hypothetical protein [Phormidium sp. CCY1219]|uniref:hypothetical protein n=1 Tax=Phormidium sp. CCY1219 TaxID=2886104 RepID=UPI002D1EC2C4|nr:hypothetical protein [Phormidium sp. CCY1219]MEB3826939.1 hypothetical protein [Phormidium sp. CCY1219]